MGTAKGMVDAMRSFVGISGRPNAVTRAYAARNGSEYLRAEWCDMTVTEAARKSGNHAAVCPNGDRAYTVWHAQDFQRLGRWYPGTKANVDKAKPGDIVFFDWGYSDRIEAIDHVGVVVKALGGGYVETIEGNTGDACKVKTRHYTVIAGYGRPAYSGSEEKNTSKRSDPVIGLQRGDRGELVKALQEMIRAAGQGEVMGETDGEYGPKTAEALRRVRVSAGSKAARDKRDWTACGNRVDPWAYSQLIWAIAKRASK